MNENPRQISLNEWDTLYQKLKKNGLPESSYGGPLGRHVEDGGFRLRKLKFDNSSESLRLWNFLLTEEDRLREAREEGKIIVGTMKDLGTIPVLAYSLPNVVAFYPDGAWWIPCIMELSAGLLGIADSLGIDESFCPVRAMLGAFITGAHFPIPDYLICSVGAVCDDFSAIAQRLNALGYPIVWWEIPHRRNPEGSEQTVTLPGGFHAPVSQVEFVTKQITNIKISLEELSGSKLGNTDLEAGIKEANRVRKCLDELRYLTYKAERCPMPALEMLIAEMLAIHFCSDREETIQVLSSLVERVKYRLENNLGYGSKEDIRIFWVNPVADIRVMNLIEECGGRLCGTEYLFTHALEEIPTHLPPIEALAQIALSDPMVGTARDRAARICRDIQRFGAETVILSKIPGASHCAFEGHIIAEEIRENLHLPVLEIEVPPVSDALRPSIKNRIQANFEVTRERRQQ